MMRTLVERLSRGVVLRRRLPRELGGARLYVSPEAGGLKYWRRDLSKVDPLLIFAARTFIRPGMRVWDVGANVGLFTFAAAACAGATGDVLAIEPDIDNVRLLLRSCGDADISRTATVCILAAAIGRDAGGVAHLRVARRSRASNAVAGFGHTQMGGIRQDRLVASISLDALVAHIPAPDFIKIDVEGAEIEVLDGARQLLAQHMPLLLLEVDRRNQTAVVDRLGPLGYKLFDPYKHSADHDALDRPGSDCLCVPPSWTRTPASVPTPPS